MRRVRTVGLCAAALVAVGLIGTGNASAFTPERGTCETAKKGMGEYLNATCTEPGTEGGKSHEFAWVPVSKAAAISWKAGEAKLTGEGWPSVTCTEMHAKGKILTATTTELIATFEGCRYAGEICTGGAKAKAGEIVTYTLDGTLGTIPGGSTVGEKFTGTGPGGLLASFECFNDPFEVRGAVVGEVTLVNSKTDSRMVQFNAFGSTEEFEEINGEPASLQAEIEVVGGGTFPFKMSWQQSVTADSPSLEVRE